MEIRDWRIEELTGYKPLTTFYKDFSIAEKFGTQAIIDTFDRAFVEWHKDYKYLTELVMVLNWKIWEHYEKGNQEIAKVYNELWEKADNYACENLKGEELSFFYRVTD
jgi:hypothetical protein